MIYNVKGYTKEKLLKNMDITNEEELMDIVHIINVFEMRKNEILQYF